MTNSNPKWYRKAGDGRNWYFPHPLGGKKISVYPVGPPGNYVWEIRGDGMFLCSGVLQKFTLQEAKDHCLRCLVLYHEQEVEAHGRALKELGAAIGHA